jgi:hypothetical protein
MTVMSSMGELSTVVGRRRSAAVAMALLVILVTGVAGTQPAHAQTLTVVYSFTGGTDGQGPGSGVIRDSAGNLYGATAHGGVATLQHTPPVPCRIQIQGDELRPDDGQTGT